MPELPGSTLGVVLMLDTVAPAVVASIERAARDNGVQLVRLDDEGGTMSDTTPEPQPTEPEPEPTPDEPEPEPEPETA